MIREVHEYLQNYMCTVVLQNQFTEASRFKTKVMFLPDSLHMILSWNLDKTSKFLCVSICFTGLNMYPSFGGACKCWILIRLITFFSDWLGWIKRSTRWIFVIFQHSSGFSFKQLPSKTTNGYSNIRNYMLHICPLFFASPNLFGSCSLNVGLSKYPLNFSRFDFPGWKSTCFGNQAIPNGH